MAQKLMLAGLAVLAALVLVPAATAGGPSLLVGAAEDIVKQPDLISAKAQMDLARLAGMKAVRSTAIWAPGQTAPDPTDLAALQNAAGAAQLDGIALYVSVYQFGSKTTPLTDQDQGDFAQFTASLAQALPTVRRFIVGNEPNINRYWLPQFGLDGQDVAAQDYERLLARTYDALKAVSPKITVIGGAVSPRGGDNPKSIRLTHSPTAFITDLGTAYRASGRTLPIMDVFAFHPYMDNSSQSPTVQHPTTTTVSINDYGKLNALLRNGFDGTAQAGSTLPVLYDEFGVESRIPAAQAALYTGKEPATTKPVDEDTQAAYYREAIALAFCQPNVQGIFLFHTVDERSLDRWQSGLYYVNGKPKSSLAPVRQAIAEARRGVIARCPGLRLALHVTRVVLPTRVQAGRRLLAAFRCDLDCAYRVRLERLPSHTTAAVTSAVATGGVTTRVTLRAPTLKPGRYRVTLRLIAALNPGPPLTPHSNAFRVG